MKKLIRQSFGAFVLFSSMTATEVWGDSYFVTDKSVYKLPTTGAPEKIATSPKALSRVYPSPSGFLVVVSTKYEAFAVTQGSSSLVSLGKVNASAPTPVAYGASRFALCLDGGQIKIYSYDLKVTAVPEGHCSAMAWYSPGSLRFQPPAEEGVFAIDASTGQTEYLDLVPLYKLGPYDANITPGDETGKPAVGTSFTYGSAVSESSSQLFPTCLSDSSVVYAPTIGYRAAQIKSGNVVFTRKNDLKVRGFSSDCSSVVGTVGTQTFVESINSGQRVMIAVP